MKTMPRLLLLLFCLSVFTMMFIARCGLNMDSQLVNGRHSGLPSSGATGSPGERALREVMRRKEVEHIRDKSMMQEKIKVLEFQLAQVQGQVVNLTANLNNEVRNQPPGELLDSNNNNIENSLIKSRDPFQLDGGADNSDEGKDTLGRKWFGPAQKDFKLLENLDLPLKPGENLDNLKVPGRNSIWDQDSLLQRQQLSHLNNGRMAQQRPGVGNRRIAPRNDGNPLINLGDLKRPLRDHVEQMRNRPNLDFGFPAQDRMGRPHPERVNPPVFPDNKHFGHHRGALDIAGVDRHALGLRDNQGLDEYSRRQAGEGLGRVARSAYAGDKDFGNPAPADSDYGGPNNAFQLHRNKSTSSDQGEGRVDENARYIQERIEAAEILHGQSYKTEYEVIPFNRFIFNRIYMVDPGLGKRVVEKPIGSKKKDISEILYQAVETLNRNRSGSNLPLYTYDHFVEGIYRSEPASGAHYELYFMNLDDSNNRIPTGLRGAGGQYLHHQQYLYTNSYVRISIFRPFTPPLSVQQRIVSTGPEWINLILPLSGRLETFKVFMDQFVSVCIKQDRRVYLTVVYFGTEGLKEVKAIMSRTAKLHRFKHMKLVTLNETFTRGRALQIGALNWKGGGDVLMFFCDVDIMFMPEFLERCRLNSEKGQRVYYPIVFSLYNPKIVYSLQDIPMPPLQDQLVLSKDTGFWRDFGYGMTCQYRSDFLKIKGFDEQITGWGGEDVFLYQKFVRSEYFVVRATDPAIFHLWHEKFCDPNLSAEQYRSCIRSKALNEASHSQLGLLAFKDEIDVHRSVKERNNVVLRNAALSAAAAGANAHDARKRQPQQPLDVLNSHLRPQR